MICEEDGKMDRRYMQGDTKSLLDSGCGCLSCCDAFYDESSLQRALRARGRPRFRITYKDDHESRNTTLSDAPRVSICQCSMNA